MTVSPHPSFNLARLAYGSLEQDIRDELDRLPEGVYLLDDEMRFRYVNVEAGKLWRRKRTALLGHVIWEVIPSLANTFIHLQHRLAMQLQKEMHFITDSPVLHREIEVTIYPNAKGLSVQFRLADSKQTGSHSGGGVTPSIL